MLSILVTMVVILAIAAVIVLYVAYPHRGADVPNVPWVGEALKRGVDALPTLDNQHDDAQHRQRSVPRQASPGHRRDKEHQHH